MFDIHGDPTKDKDAALHCTACYKVLTAACLESAECQHCGITLTPIDAMFTGRMMRQEIQDQDDMLDDWERLIKEAKGRK